MIVLDLAGSDLKAIAMLSTNTQACPTTNSICVAICTHNRTKQLHRALHSLMAQTRPPAEILVIDNAPSDETTRILISDEFPAVRYIRESTRGLDFARNRAIAETEMDIVAFIDDDTVAASDWVSSTLTAFEASEQIAICTGKVDALSLETDGQQLFEANGGFARGDLRIHLPHDKSRHVFGLRLPLIAWSISVGSGCSFAVRRRFVLDLGGFDDALDLGAELPGGGDLDMLWRALEAGHEVVYEPAVQAQHEHRRELQATIDQILGHNRSLIAVLTKALMNARGRDQISVFAFLLWRLIKPGARLGRRAFNRDPLPAKVLLRLWWHCWRGLGTYPAACRLAQQRIAESASPG